MFARPVINSLEFARNGLASTGDIPLDRLSRLADLLASPVGSLSYTLRGSTDQDGDFLLLDLDGTILLRCQRCLGELEHIIHQQSQVKLVAAESLSAIEDPEGVDCIEALPHLDVWTLVEDELLLGLPFAPRHENEGCHPVVNELKRVVGPFAGLADLKR